MVKMQILFPEQQLQKLRTVAGNQDRPVSEIVRSAVDFWLSRYGSETAAEAAEPMPLFSCGRLLQEPQAIREKAYDGREDW